MKQFLRVFISTTLLLIYTSAKSQNTYKLEHLLIKKKSTWKYHDGNELNETNWQSDTVLHKKWKYGKAPLGYASDSLNTTIRFGTDPEDKHLVTYFTKTIEIKNPLKFKAYIIHLRRDDGAIIYINGKEIWKSNITHDSNTYNEVTIIKTVTKSAETRYFSRLLLPYSFKKGPNIISIAVYQRSPSSTDLVFDLELVGTNNNNLIQNTTNNSDSDDNSPGYDILNSKIELEKKELNNQLLLLKTDTLENQKTTLIIVSICLFILSIVFLILYFYRQKKHNIITKELNETINYKDKEAITNSLKSIEHKQFLEYLKKDLEKLNSTNKSETYLDILKAIKQIDYNLEQLNEWEDLKGHFNAVHSGFFERIHINYPSLTQNELKHCSLIKLHLSTKEISKILYINPRSVQASRYRIKKKLHLEENTDLKKFLKNY